jgi:hypothetical protein
MKRQLLDYLVKKPFALKLLSRYGRLKRKLLPYVPGEALYVPDTLLQAWSLPDRKWLNLRESLHYNSLSDPTIYKNYLNRFGARVGYPAHTSVRYFTNLCRTLRYLEGRYKRHHILVVRCADHYQIVDGLHRAAILAHRYDQWWRENSTEYPYARPRTNRIQVRVVHPLWLKLLDYK